jgi:hypothetical protein
MTDQLEPLVDSAYKLGIHYIYAFTSGICSLVPELSPGHLHDMASLVTGVSRFSHSYFAFKGSMSANQTRVRRIFH